MTGDAPLRGEKERRGESGGGRRAVDGRENG